MAYLQNPKLLEQAEVRIRQLFDMSACHESRGVDAEQDLRF
jgi:hypothetical protein